MNDKMKKAEYLFDEIGFIDDGLIAQALNVRKNPRVGFARKIIAVAAVFATLSVIAVSVFIGNNIKKSDSEVKGPQSDMSESQDLPSSGESGNAVIAVEKLNASLVKAESNADVKTYSDSLNIDLFSGKASIIWKDAGRYYSFEVDDREGLYGIIRNSKQNCVYPEELSADKAISIWICTGDGKVISPYLKNSYGNVSYGNLFSYIPEVLPDSELWEFIDGMSN